MSKDASSPYNPLDTENIGASLLRAIMEMEPVRLDQMKPFPGVGVYALYYSGDFKPYARLAAANADCKFTQAIYVGKAVPSGGRKGLIHGLGSTTERKIYNRLAKHRRSIEAASNLRVEHFWVRWLVTEPVWIPLTESILINRSAAAWNALIEGFGSNDPGVERHTGKRSKWDTLHMGRWYGELAKERVDFTANELELEVETWIDQRL